MATATVAWIDLESTPLRTNHLLVPTGINQNNYIVVEYDSFDPTKINFIQTNIWTEDLIGNMFLCDSNYVTLVSKQNVLYSLNEKIIC